MLRQSGKKDTFTPTDLEELKGAWLNSHGLMGMLNWYRAAFRYPSRHPAQIRLSMPVLMLWGRKDMALSDEMAEASLLLCEKGKLVFFDTASHWVQHDEADEVNKRLLEFLNPHE